VDNQKDLVEIPDNIKGNLTIKPVKWIDEVLAIALAEQPKPAATPASGNDASKTKSVRKASRARGKGVPAAH
jgi:ATP-dependent Lon protease